MNTLFTVGKVIYSILSNDEKLKEYVGNNIYPCYMPRDTKGDAIIYMRDEYIVERTKMGIARQQCRVYLNAVSDNYNKCQDIGELIFLALEGKQSGEGWKVTIEFEDSAEDVEDSKYINVLRFLITLN